MSKRVIFRIDAGDFEQGFPVTLTIKENGEVCAPEVRGKLAPAPEILDLYDRWQKAYYAWGESYRWWRRKIDVPQQMETNSSSDDREDEANNYAREFEAALNQWLDRSSLQKLTRQLLHTVGKNEAVSFIVETDNQDLQKLPWELWNFLQDPEYYDHPEVALSSKRFPKTKPLSGEVKILVIMGNNKNIDIETDWNIIQKKLIQAKLILLPKPSSSQLRETLRSQDWNIIFFAGHSGTQPEGNDGRIWLNDEEYLSPDQLRISLNKAAKNGLKLAIFNSCDGLGLARQLESLQIPHIIVMREPIHDRVAQMFLDAFLTEFAKGASLHEAVREARDQLRLIENSSLKASWLPVIFQNPEEEPLFYPLGTTKENPKTGRKINWKLGAIAIPLIVVTAVLLPRLLSVFYPEQKACDAQLNINLLFSCGEKALMNPKDRPAQLKKQQGIEAIAQKQYSKAVELLSQAWNEKKDPETLVYLNNAKIMADKIPEDRIYTIPLVVPISNVPDDYSQQIVKGVAWLQDRVNQNTQNPQKIRVLIADDGNNIPQAQAIAKELVKRGDILVVIGHYSSHITTNVKSIYQRNKLVLVSPSAAAFQGLNSTDYVNNFFFRSTPSAQLASKRLADYLSAKNYQNIAIFYTKGKAFSESFKKEFKTHLNQRVKIVGDFDLGEDTSQVKSNLARVKKEFKDAALVLLPDAYTNPNEADNQLAVIQENNGELLIAGNETVKEDQVLVLGRQALRKMVVVTPLYPSSSNNKQFQDFWGKTKKPTWPVILSYDALQMAIHAIEIQPFKPSRIGVQQVLANRRFEIKGLSGRITLNGSDRAENTSTLIEPDCSPQSCYWRPIKK